MSSPISSRGTFGEPDLRVPCGTGGVDFLSLIFCHTISLFKLRISYPQDFIALQGFCLSLFTIYAVRTQPNTAGIFQGFTIGITVYKFRQ